MDTARTLRTAAFLTGTGLGLAWIASAARGRMRIRDFADRGPSLVLQDFFAGRTEGWGILQDRLGILRRQMRIDAEGRWDEATRTLALTETWHLDDGTVDRLEWTVRHLGGSLYEGREPRVEGVACGEQAGNAFHWMYSRRVPGAGDRILAFDDWFWLQEGGTLISRASVRRFGVEVGTLSVFYRKTTDADAGSR